MRAGLLDRVAARCRVRGWSSPATRYALQILGRNKAPSHLNASQIGWDGSNTTPDLAIQQQGEKWVGHLRIVYSVQAETGKDLGGILDNLDLNLKQEVWSGIIAKGLVLRKEFNPPNGASKVRIAIYDLSTGRIGSVSIPLALAK